MHSTIGMMMNPFDFVIQLPFSWRQRRARAGRDGMTREQFVAALAKDAPEGLAAGLLWDKLADAAVVSDFRPSPDDNFLHTYGLADEDLDEDVILEILTLLGYQPPLPDVLQRVGQISTPRDFIELVRQLGRAESPPGTDP